MVQRVVQKSAPVLFQRNTNMVEPVPGGTDGFFVGDKSLAVLRIRTAGNPTYALEIYTRGRQGGAQFIHAPNENRTIATPGEEFTRNYRVGPISENIAARITAISSGNLFLEWSAT